MTTADDPRQGVRREVAGFLALQVTEGAGRRDRTMATIASHSFRAL